VKLGAGYSWIYHNAGEQMLVIKVWCLPKQTEEQLLDVLNRIVEATVLSGHLPTIRGKSDILVLFPQDLMRSGLGEEILVEISSGPFGVRPIYALGQKIGQALLALFPKAHVECHHISRTDNLWSSIE